ncbi:MAG: hypothetical protein IAE80_10395 [Anaerolinea sp.]|nr:hypothetical protein [Anaerolinea sp.]
MNFNQNDLRSLRERQKDLERQARKERLVKEAKDASTSKRPSTPLWARLWSLF